MCIRPRPPPAPGWGKWYPEQPGEGVLGGRTMLRGGTPILPPWVTPGARCLVVLALEKLPWAGRGAGGCHGAEPKSAQPSPFPGWVHTG